MPPTPTPPRRPWYQFSIGTMLWLMLTTALAVYGFIEHQKRVRAEDELRTGGLVIDWTQNLK